MTVKYATEHRCGVCVRGPGLSDAVTGTDPLRDHLPLRPCEPTDGSAEAAATARLVEELSAEMRRVLSGHEVNRRRRAEGKGPANAVLLRGCGSRLEAPPFAARHGLRAFMVAPTKCILGIGVSCGVHPADAPGATGDYRTQLAAKAAAVSGGLASGGFDLSFCHIKAVDDAGHDRNAALRVAWIEAVDAFLLQLLGRLSRDGAARYTLALGADHSTPVEYGDHSHEPVPFALCHVEDAVAALGADAVAAAGEGPLPCPTQAGADALLAARVAAPAAAAEAAAAGAAAGAAGGRRARAFTERACAGGELGRFLGSEVMRVIKSYAGYPLDAG